VELSVTEKLISSICSVMGHAAAIHILRVNMLQSLNKL